MNLYVGNLSFETNEDELQTAFAPFGRVESVTIIRDKFSGDSRGFAFVEMPEREEALAAMSGLAGTEVHGRMLTVNEARPRDDNQRRGGRSGGGRNGGSGGRRSW
jgi:RNA recognition motif-containing protein